MGYSYYELPDGREAGYTVEAVCDYPGCKREIDRGLGYLCGEWPKGLAPAFATEGLFGCGDYFCEYHKPCHEHECDKPICAVYAVGEQEYCFLIEDHAGEHYDYVQNIHFTEVSPDFIDFDPLTPDDEISDTMETS